MMAVVFMNSIWRSAHTYIRTHTIIWQPHIGITKDGFFLKNHCQKKLNISKIKVPKLKYSYILWTGTWVVRFFTCTCLYFSSIHYEPGLGLYGSSLVRACTFHIYTMNRDLGCTVLHLYVLVLFIYTLWTGTLVVWFFTCTCLYFSYIH